MDEKLQNIANKLGIATSFLDSGVSRKTYEINDKIIKFFAKAMGYSAEDATKCQNSILRFEAQKWQRLLEPIYVCPLSDIKITVRSYDINNLKITAKDNNNQTFNLNFYLQEINESYNGLNSHILKITDNLAIGYYDLTISLGGIDYNTTLAVAPLECYDFDKSQKLKGVAIQLYSLRSKRNWGIGDFTDLKNFVILSAKNNIDVIGINPLNILSHDYPENASPYASISRLFLNPIYIDIEAVPEYKTTDKDKNTCELLAQFHQSELIDYTQVYNLKIKFLEKLYNRFKTSSSPQRQQEFNDFCISQGQDLQNLALFQALYEVETTKVWGGCMAWPKEYQTPLSYGIKDFIKSHQERINFFKFMQFEASRQLDLVQAEIKKQHLKIGLYRDLAVGVGRDSAEYWSQNELFIKEAGCGAPPDAFFSNGQKWGLATFIPQVLKDNKYLPFIKILRANMKNAGALRLDHVMSLMRLYVIPDMSESGTYIYYNFSDMLNIVALESVLNECVIVGESIGNVPDGFIDSLRDKNIYSLSILWAERLNNGLGEFKSPQQYPVSAFTSVATHDIAPLKMWWFGYDIELKANLAIIPSSAKVPLYHQREHERKELLTALDRAGVWPQDRLRSGDFIFGEKYPEGIKEAIFNFMSQTSSPVFLLQLEDVFEVIKMQNLPGTDKDKYPNWRLKLPINLEDYPKNPDFLSCMNILKKAQ